MIIKSRIRGGYRSAAAYLKDQGENEYTRLVEISDPDAKNLEDAFHNMWVVASNTRCTKPLHHVSINPFKDERLTDDQVFKIADRLEELYGYKLFHHQRVIVEHVKEGRQHFHVMWNRVSLHTGRPVWPGHHWLKSKQAAREMEVKLGLKRLGENTGKKFPRLKKPKCPPSYKRLARKAGHYKKLTRKQSQKPPPKPKNLLPLRLNLRRGRPVCRPFPNVLPFKTQKDASKKHENLPDSEKLPVRQAEWETAQLLIWAFETGRADILAQFGIYVEPEIFEP